MHIYFVFAYLCEIKQKRNHITMEKKLKWAISGFIILLLASTTSLFAQNSTEGKITFRVKKGFSTVQGEFQKFNYNIDLNGQVGGSAEVASIKTKSSKRDEHLQSEEWFNAKNFPQIEVISQKIEKKSGENFVGTFSIKIKGKTETKEIPFKIIKENEKNFFRMNFTLSLKTFNIGSGFLGFLVGDNVTVDLNLPF